MKEEVIRGTNVGDNERQVFCILSNFRKERWLSKETSWVPRKAILEKGEEAHEDLQNNKILSNINNESLEAIQPSSG